MLVNRLTIAAAALALLVGACSSETAAAATVNGTAIDDDQVRALVFDGSAMADAEFTQLLEILVQWTAIADAAAEDFDLSFTEEQLDVAVDRIVADQGQGATFDEFLEAQNISADGIGQYAAQLLIGEAILGEFEGTVEQPTEAEARQLLVDDPGSWTEVCTAHILLATEEEATAVLERLAAGEEFATLATELSVDTGSAAVGGDLGCAVPGPIYVPEFTAATLTAEIGVVTDPVESQFGFHLVLVNSRTEATLEELQSGLYDTRLSDAVDEWYLAALSRAEVSIDERWGTWSTEPFPGIVPVPDLVEP